MISDIREDTIVIGFCALHQDWLYYNQRIVKSFENINSELSGKCVFLLAIQGEGESVIDIPGLKNVKSTFLSVKGISIARNWCIEQAIELKATWILFHDASIYWTKKSAKFIYMHRYSPIPIRLKLKFKSSVDDENDDFSFTEIKINPIYKPYVCTILFDLSFIAKNRFDEDYGPGENTKYKSGEDVLFIHEYFSCLEKFNILESNSLSIYHPPRDNDFKKHLLYARGQGRVFRVLISKEKSFRIWIDFSLFIANALFRCMLFKNNSFSILRERIAGFLDEV